MEDKTKRIILYLIIFLLLMILIGNSFNQALIYTILFFFLLVFYPNLRRWWSRQNSEDKGFYKGIISGLIIACLTAIVLNPTLSANIQTESHIEKADIIAHYEFATDNTTYAEYKDVEYSLSPPLIKIPFTNNNRLQISKPDGYGVVSITPKFEDECVKWL